MFYNEPTPPTGLFDDFLAIPALAKDVHTRDFPSLVKSLGVNNSSGLRYVLVLAEPSSLCDFVGMGCGLRGAFSCIPLQRLTPTILKVIQKQAEVGYYPYPPI
jgi:hypothetical protein